MFARFFNFCQLTRTQSWLTGDHSFQSSLAANPFICNELATSNHLHIRCDAVIHPTTSTYALATPLAQRRFRLCYAPPLLQRRACQARACQRRMCNAAACATALLMQYIFVLHYIFFILLICGHPCRPGAQRPACRGAARTRSCCQPCLLFACCVCHSFVCLRSCMLRSCNCDYTVVRV